MTLTDLPPGELVERIRAGDAEAAAELVRRYEPEIRRSIHHRLHDTRLRRAFDSMDICQSVLGNFFIYASTHALEVDKPDQLLHLLVTMTRNKLRDAVRHERRAKRDSRRQVAGAREMLQAVPGHDATPSRVVGARELLSRVRKYLPADDLYVAEERAAGREWADLAEEMGTTPEALRKRLSRALELVSRKLGGNDAPDA
jgi:RNA polymerase sigma-70 factor (ECF subfamily)